VAEAQQIEHEREHESPTSESGLKEIQPNILSKILHLKRATAFSGCAGERRCQSRHRSEISKDL
jgi:hypothetical protein